MPDDNIPDIDYGIDSLSETVTAADLVRQKGQNKRLRTIDKSKLKMWIMQAIGQARAHKSGEYEDAEKEELLKETQNRLNEMMKRAQDAEKAIRERETRDGALHDEIERLKGQAAENAAAGAASSNADLEKALATIEKLRQQREESQRLADDRQQDLFEMEDQLSEKMALMQTTIKEKDDLSKQIESLKGTVQGLMIRAGDLTGGVIRLDDEYYASRHQEENPRPEDAEMEEEFYHDFEVGAAIVATLHDDLKQLREITSQKQEQEETQRLFKSDLELLRQMQEGNLAAADVAEPVMSLVEAMEGAREAAVGLDRDAAELNVGRPGARFSQLMDPEEGRPEEVLASATTVARELAAALAAQRGRLAAMKALADDADQARASSEDDVEGLENAIDAIVKAVDERTDGAASDGVAANSSPTDRLAAAAVAMGDMKADAKGDEEIQASLSALNETLALHAERLAADVPADVADEKQPVAARIQAARTAVESMSTKAETALSEFVEDEDTAAEEASDELQLEDESEVAASTTGKPGSLIGAAQRAAARWASERQTRTAAVAAVAGHVRTIADQLYGEEAEEPEAIAALRDPERHGASDFNDVDAALAVIAARLQESGASGGGSEQGQRIAGAVLEAARSDETLAEDETVEALAGAVADAEFDGGSEELDNAAVAVVGLLVRRYQTAQEEVARLSERERDSQRQLADALHAAAKADDQLAGDERVARLSEEHGGQHEADREMDFEDMRAVVTALSERKAAIAAERDELRRSLMEIAKAAEFTAGDQEEEGAEDIAPELESDDEAMEAGISMRGLELAQELRARLTDLKNSQQRIAALEQSESALRRQLSEGEQQQTSAKESIESERRDLLEQLAATRAERDKYLALLNDVATAASEPAPPTSGAYATQPPQPQEPEPTPEDDQAASERVVEEVNAAIIALENVRQERDAARARLEELEGVAEDLSHSRADRDRYRNLVRSIGNSMGLESASDDDIESLPGRAREVGKKLATVEPLAERVPELEARIAELDAQILELNQEAGRAAGLDGEVEKLTGQRDRLAAALQELSVAAHESTGRDEDDSGRFTTATNIAEAVQQDDIDLDQIRSDSSNLAQQLRAALKQSQEDHVEIARVRDQLAESRSSLQQVQERAEIAGREAEEHEERGNLLQEELDQLRRFLRNIRSELEEFKARDRSTEGGKDTHIAELKERIAELEEDRDTSLDGIKQQLAERREEVSTLQAKLRALEESAQTKEQQVRALEESLADERASAAALREGRDELRSQLSSIEEEHKHATVNLREQVARLQDDRRASVSDLRLQMDEEHEQLAALRAKVEELKSAAAAKEEQLRTAEESLADERATATAIRESRDELRAELASIEDDHKAAMADVRQQLHEVEEEKERAVADVRSQLDEEHEQLATARARFDDLKKAMEEKDAQLQDIGARLADEQARSEALSENRDQLRGELETIEEAHKEALFELRQEVERLQEEVREQRAELDGARARVRSLTEIDDEDEEDLDEDDR